MYGTFHTHIKFLAKRRQNLVEPIAINLSFQMKKMLGGYDSLNAMLYIRGVSEDFNEWNVTEWKYDDVLPYFHRCEGNQKRS